MISKVEELPLFIQFAVKVLGYTDPKRVPEEKLPAAFWGMNEKGEMVPWHDFWEATMDGRRVSVTSNIGAAGCLSSWAKGGFRRSYEVTQTPQRFTCKVHDGDGAGGYAEAENKGEAIMLALMKWKDACES